MTDEEKWEIWRNKNAEIKKPYGGIVHKHIVWYEGVDRRKAFLDGLTEGRKEKWHDLRKNPNDLPNQNTLVIMNLFGNVYSKGWFDEDGWIVDNGNMRKIDCGYVIAWCEHPKFEED